MTPDTYRRIPDGKGDYVFNAVPTTDWGSADTLEFWREQWAVMCNAKFEEKGLDVRIDHRSFERQGVELLPTRHEGPTVRAMEKKGIKTEKGEFNRWIKRTNAFIRDLRKSLSTLLESIKEIKSIYPDILVEQAAGITNGQQVYDFIMAGSEAAGAASGIMNAADPIAMIDEMIAATRRAADDLKKKEGQEK